MDALRATAIEISDFRCFKQFKAEGFERINLLVGKNNSGKTALLEALEIGLSGGHPARVALQLIRREEFYGLTSPVEQFALEDEQLLDVRQLFYGRKLITGADLRISVSSGTERIGLGMTYAPDHKHTLRATNLAHIAKPWNLLVYEQVAVTSKDFAAKARKFGEDNVALRSVDTSRMTAKSLANIWKQVVLTDRESERAVVDALQAIDPAVDDVLCIDTEGRLGWSSFQLGFRGSSARAPLGSLGEGVGRMFGLALAAVGARGGALLIDELEGGFHYSVFDSIWRWLIDRAKQGNFQLFATTHSEDCVRALGALATSSPELAREISLHRIVPEEGTTRRFSGARLADATESNLEVR